MSSQTDPLFVSGSEMLAHQRGAEDPAADDRVKRELARELHDQVVQDLTAMLIDLENFKRGPFDSQSTVLQVDSVQGSLRTMLGRLRGMLYGLRGEDATLYHGRGEE